MGVIQRQSLKAGIVNYAGAFIGILNTFFLFTLCFTEGELGEIRYIQEVAILLASFTSLGFFNVVIRFFPEFKTSDNKNRGILTLAILVLVIGLLILAIILFGFESYLPSNVQENNTIIFLVALAIVFGTLGAKYSSNFGLITIPSLFNNLYIKFAIALVGLAYFYNFFEFEFMLNSLGIVYLSSTLFILWYLKKKGNLKLSFDFSFFNKKRLKRIAVFAGFGILGTVGSGLANKIDIFMVSDMLNFSRTGVYTIALNASNLLMIPTAGILAVSGPVIVKSLKANDLDEVESIYKKAGINLFLFGSFILLLLWSNVDLIFEIIPNGKNYESGKIVILILGAAKLFDMLTSVNELIISYSKYFRFNLYALIVLAVINIIANIIFIPLFDIAGAAIATFMSIVLYNIFKTIFIFIKFKIHPFQFKLVYIAVLSVVLYFISLYIPMFNNPFVNLGARSIFLTTIFAIVVIKLHISQEATDLWIKAKTILLATFRK